MIDHLSDGWSPEQICGRRVSHDLSAIRLCAETIYRFIYSKEEYALKLYERLADRHSKPIMNKIIHTFAALPYHAHGSFTLDRGCEFLAYQALEDGMGARSWFCDPNSP